MIGSHFSDSGLFGLQVEGPGEHSVDLLSVALEMLADLRNPISDAELNRAKNITKMNMLMALERQEDRVEELARNYMTYGRLTFQDYCDKVDKVSSQ